MRSLDHLQQRLVSPGALSLDAQRGDDKLFPANHERCSSGLLDVLLVSLLNCMHQGLDPSGPHTGFDYDLAPARLDAVEPGLRSFYAQCLDVLCTTVFCLCSSRVQPANSDFPPPDFEGTATADLLEAWAFIAKRLSGAFCVVAV